MGWDANILNLCLDKNDVMWVNQDRYGLCLHDLSKIYLQIMSGNNLSNPGSKHIVKSKQEGVWISPRYGARVMRMTPSGYEYGWKRILSLKNKSIIRENIRDLVEDNKGSLWIFSQSGLYVKRPDNSILLVASS